MRRNEKEAVSEQEEESDGALLILGEKRVACHGHGIDHGIKKQPGRSSHGTEQQTQGDRIIPSASVEQIGDHSQAKRKHSEADDEKHATP